MTRVSVEVDVGDTPFRVEVQGHWTVTARLAWWDERTPGPGSIDGVVIVHRGEEQVAKVGAFRFPAGWRVSADELAAAEIPAHVKAAARRVARKLP